MQGIAEQASHPEVPGLACGGLHWRQFAPQTLFIAPWSLVRFLVGNLALLRVTWLGFYFLFSLDVCKLIFYVQELDRVQLGLDTELVPVTRMF